VREGGYLRIAEREEGGASRIDLEFAAGSDPKHAAGLNRLGAFEEPIVESGGSLVSASCFGCLSASREKNLREARSALQEHQSAVTAISGRIEGGRVRNRLVRLSGLVRSGWTERAALTEEVRRRLETGSANETELRAAGVEPQTFLYAVRHAMLAGGGNRRQCFVHNGELLHLLTSARAAGRAGIASAAARHHRGGPGQPPGSFQLWYDAREPCPAPILFEFRPRSFLRLAFDRVRIS
jgi:hypothetical protein